MRAILVFLFCLVSISYAQVKVWDTKQFKENLEFKLQIGTDQQGLPYLPHVAVAKDSSNQDILVNLNTLGRRELQQIKSTARGVLRVGKRDFSGSIKGNDIELALVDFKQEDLYGLHPSRGKRAYAFIQKGLDALVTVAPKGSSHPDIITLNGQNYILNKGTTGAINPTIESTRNKGLRSVRVSAKGYLLPNKDHTRVDIFQATKIALYGDDVDMGNDVILKKKISNIDRGQASGKEINRAPGIQGFDFPAHNPRQNMNQRINKN